MSGSRSSQKQNNGSQDGSSFALIAAGIGAVVAVGTYFLGRSHGSQIESSTPVRTHNNTQSTSSRSPRTSSPPVRRFTDAEVPDCSTSNDSKSCSICYTPFDFISDKGEQIHSTPCGHVFCHYCIYNSLTVCERCPICRTTVRPEETSRIHL